VQIIFGLEVSTADLEKLVNDFVDMVPELKDSTVLLKQGARLQRNGYDEMLPRLPLPTYDEIQPHLAVVPTFEHCKYSETQREYFKQEKDFKETTVERDPQLTFCRRESNFRRGQSELLWSQFKFLWRQSKSLKGSLVPVCLAGIIQ